MSSSAISMFCLMLSSVFWVCWVGGATGWEVKCVLSLLEVCTGVDEGGIVLTLLSFVGVVVCKWCRLFVVWVADLFLS